MEILLSGAIDGYWLSRRRDLSVNTQRDYTLTFRRLVEFAGDVPFRKIDGRKLNQFMNHLEATFELGEKTRLNAWIALSALWSWAESEPALKTPHIVREHVAAPDPQDPIIRPYTEDEVKRLLDACDWFEAYAPELGSYVRSEKPNAVRDKAIIMIMVDGGLRASEVCGLAVSDYEQRRGQLTIRHGKGDKKRQVYLGEVARKSLWRYLATRKAMKRDDPLLMSRDGGALSRFALRSMIEHLGQRAGVDGATCHRFRHTFAINFLRNGGNLFALQEMLGHASLEMVKNYAKIAELDLETAQKRASVADNWRL